MLWRVEALAIRLWAYTAQRNAPVLQRFLPGIAARRVGVDDFGPVRLGFERDDH
jgi:hypothetical protein